MSGKRREVLPAELRERIGTLFGKHGDAFIKRSGLHPHTVLSALRAVATDGGVIPTTRATLAATVELYEREQSVRGDSTHSPGARPHD